MFAPARYILSWCILGSGKIMSPWLPRELLIELDFGQDKSLKPSGQQYSFRSAQSAALLGIMELGKASNGMLNNDGHVATGDIGADGDVLQERIC
jgi:hypothetical protein